MRQRAMRGRPLCACGALDSDVLELHSWGVGHRAAWLGLLAVVSDSQFKNEREPTSAAAASTPSPINHNHPSTKAAWDWVGKPWVAGWETKRTCINSSQQPARGQASRRVACVHSRSVLANAHARGTRPGPGPPPSSLAEFLAPRSSFFLKPEMRPPQPVDSSPEKALKACVETGENKYQKSRWLQDRECLCG